MRPSQASAALRQIASRIDHSRRPDRALVARDLKRVIAGLRTAGTIMEAMGDGSFESRVKKALEYGNQYFGLSVSLVKVESLDPNLGAITLSMPGVQPWRVLFSAEEDADAFFDDTSDAGFAGGLPGSAEEAKSFGGTTQRAWLGEGTEKV